MKWCTLGHVMGESLRVLVFRGTSGLFVAICLDHDLAAQGKTAEEAVLALDGTYHEYHRIAARRGERPFHHGRHAPEEFWLRYEKAQPMSIGAVGAQVRAA